MKTLVATTAIFVCTSFAVSATPITFFGENLTPNAMVSGDPVTARDEFLANLEGGFGTEDFESGGLTLTFPGSSGDIEATLSGGSTGIESSSGLGRFATSGSNFVETGEGGDFNIAFNTAISAFGFFATDIGDFGNSLGLRLTLEGGGTVDLDVPNTVGSDGDTDGALLFFGFVDTEDTYTNISFFNDPTGDDVFGFDDLIVGDAGQVIAIPDPQPNPVPLPASILLLGTALAGFGATRRKKAV